MRMLQLSVVVTVFFLCPSQPAAEEILTPAEAMKQEGNGRTVTVEFVVKSYSPLLPHGTHFQLTSERLADCPSGPWGAETFVVHLSDEAVARMGANLREYLLFEKTVQVRGKVVEIVGSARNYTGIWVDDPADIWLVEQKSDSFAQPKP